MRCSADGRGTLAWTRTDQSTPSGRIGLANGITAANPIVTIINLTATRPSL